MSDVKVPMNSDNAVLLLEAAQKAEQAPDVVRTTSQGYFLVPEEIAKDAGVAVIDESGEAAPKKAAAKKAPAKKTASAKSADKE